METVRFRCNLRFPVIAWRRYKSGWAMTADAAMALIPSHGLASGRRMSAGWIKVAGCFSSRFSISDSPP